MPILELYNKNSLPDTYHPHTLARVRINATVETSTHKDTCGWCTDEICKYEVEDVELVFDWKPMWDSDWGDNCGIYTFRKLLDETTIDDNMCRFYHKPIKEQIFDEPNTELHIPSEDDFDYWLSVLPIPNPMEAFGFHDRCDICKESLSHGLYAGDFRYTIHKVEILKKFEVSELKYIGKNKTDSYKCCYYCVDCENKFNKYNVSPYIAHDIDNTLNFSHFECQNALRNYINKKELQNMAMYLDIDLFTIKKNKKAKKTEQELYTDIRGCIEKKNTPLSGW